MYARKWLAERSLLVLSIAKTSFRPLNVQAAAYSAPSIRGVFCRYWGQRLNSELNF